MANILIMEDDVDFGGLLALSMQDSGHDVTLCTNGTDAQAAFESNWFHLVVTDIFVHKEGRLSPDGGILLCWRVSQIAKTQRRTVPIIAITGCADPTHREEVLKMAEDLGAHASLFKPFAPDELLYEIEKLLPGAAA